MITPRLTPKPRSALLIAAHGSTVNPDSSAPSWEHADAIRRSGLFGEVRCGFWKEEPSFREVFNSFESDEIYVVPNFISDGYFTQTIIPREMELEGAITHHGGRTIKYCEPVGSHPRMTEILLARAEQAAPGVPQKAAALLITGHGTGLNENSAKAAKQQAEIISGMQRFAEVHSTYMEEAPLVSDWATLTHAPNVIVVPFFISDGLHSYQDIPVLLGMETEPTAAASQRDIFRRNPYHLQGRSLYYAAALGSDPAFADLVIDQVAAFDLAHDRHH